MNPREIAAWGVLLFTVIVCTVCSVWTTFRPPPDRTPHMQVSDCPGPRQSLLVSAKITAGPAVGHGAQVSINGNDGVGQINIQTGTGTAAGDIVHVTFATPYEETGVQPFVSVGAIDQPPISNFYNTIDWWGFDILTSSVPKPSTNYAFSYAVICRPWAMYLSHASGLSTSE